MRFVERWGPWGACLERDHAHRPLSQGMRPSQLPRPPGARPSEDVADVVASARRFNQLRAIAALARVPTPDDESNAAAAIEARAFLDGLLGPGSAKPYVAPGKSMAVVERWLASWLAEAHVVPAMALSEFGSPALLAVGGASGALAAALWIELSLPLRTAICGDCGTTWRPGKNWGPELLIGPARQCRTCWKDGYQKEFRHGRRRRSGGRS